MKERNEGQLEGRTVEDGDDRGDVIEKEWNVEGRDFHRILPRGGGGERETLSKCLQDKRVAKFHSRDSFVVILVKILEHHIPFFFRVGREEGEVVGDRSQRFHLTPSQASYHCCRSHHISKHHLHFCPFA